MGQIKELWMARELLQNLVARDVNGQYKRTVLGRLWSLASPLSAMLVYTFVFSFIFRIQPAPGDPSGLNYFAAWLLCGLLPWTFFSGAVSSGMASLVGNAGLITKVYFPRTVLPLAAIGSTGVNWLFEMGILVVVLMVVGAWVLPFLPLVIMMMVVLAAFAAGLALMLSIANVYFRDTQYLLTLIFQVWMYLTPIVYPVSLVAEQSERVGTLFGTSLTVLDIYQWNPLYHFVSVFRQLLYDNRLPDLNSVIICLLWAAVALTVGLWVFRKNERGLAEAL